MNLRLTLEEDGQVRIVRVLLLSLLVGLAVGLFKGNSSGDLPRGAIGNLSAPWLLVPAVAAWRAGSWGRGAAIGLAATMVALLGFYAGMTYYVHDHLGLVRDHPGAWRSTMQAFWFVVRANRIWFAAGVLSGPFMGAIAGEMGHRLSAAWLWVLAGVVLAGELPVVGLVADVRLPVLGWAWGVTDWTVYGAEAVLGVAVLALGAARLRRPSRVQ